MKIIFWLSLAFIFYTFFGYAILLFILIKLKTFFIGKRKLPDNDGEWPSLTVVVAAYNEDRFIGDKIANTLALSYLSQTDQLTVHHKLLLNIQKLNYCILWRDAVKLPPFIGLWTR